MRGFNCCITKGLKQIDLVEALKKRNWSQKQAAEHFGVSPSVFGRWMRGKGLPKSFSAEISMKFFKLTGKTPEQLFPGFTESFFCRNDVCDKVELVGGHKGVRMMVSDGHDPEAIVILKEMHQAIRFALGKLSPIEERVLRARFFDEMTFEEIGLREKLTRQRIYQILQKALRKLRHPAISRELRKCNCA